MDRSWMHADRRSCEYKLGVSVFCKFALENARDPNHIACPCTKCGNVEYFSASVIKDHLFLNGIDESYEKWTEHGEALMVDSGTDGESDGMETNSDESKSVEGNVGAEYEVELDSDVELESDGYEELSNECNEFRQFVDDANKPLYPGCESHTKLNVLVRLYNLKAKHGMSDVAYSEWLIALGEYLPVGNEIPATVYEAKKTLSALGMDYNKIHACPNDCILYRKEYADEIKCPRCGLSRWKVGKNSTEREGVPAKKPTKGVVERRRRKKMLQEDEDSEVQFSFQKLAPALPASLKMLCLWGEEKFKDGGTISFEMESEVFGYTRKTYIMGTDVRRLASMREVTANCIVMYQRYLYDVLAKSKMLDMVAFVDPALIGGKGCGAGTMRSQNIKNRLITAKPGQLFMLPYNSDAHWMLTVVDPENEIVYFMDPMKRRLVTGEWIGIVDAAIAMYNAHKSRNGRSSVTWKNLAGIPPQPSDKECGYFVMRYMKDIISDTNLSFASKWERRGHTYSQEDIDEVRNDWASFVVNTYV